TSTNRLPTPLLTAYQKRAPPSIHCGLTLSPMTTSPGRAGRRRRAAPAGPLRPDLVRDDQLARAGGSAEELLRGLVVLSGAHSFCPFLGVGFWAFPGWEAGVGVPPSAPRPQATARSWDGATGHREAVRKAMRGDSVRTHVRSLTRSKTAGALTSPPH